MERTQLELEETRSQLKLCKRSEQDLTEQLCQCHSEAFRAVDILKDALSIKGNSPNKIKAEIKKVLPLIDDV